METINKMLNIAGASGGLWATFILMRSYVRVNPFLIHINRIYLILILLSLLTTCRRLFVLWQTRDMQFWFWFITPAIVFAAWSWVVFMDWFVQVLTNTKSKGVDMSKHISSYKKQGKNS